MDIDRSKAWGGMKMVFEMRMNEIFHRTFQITINQVLMVIGTYNNNPYSIQIGLKIEH